MDGLAILQEDMHDWLSCKRCGLWRHRRKVVLGRGVIPARVLMIGQAPGKTEDLRGQAFIGRSGKILDKLTVRATTMARLLEAPTIFITNVVCCFPSDQDGKDREPTGEEAWACWPRLERTYELVQPQEVVFLGRCAERYCHPAWPEGTMIYHTAYIARQGGERSALFRAEVRNLSDVFSRVRHTGGRLIRRGHAT